MAPLTQPIEHLQCSSCLPDHCMKEACVGQWSQGTLVPVSACADVGCVYGYKLSNPGKGKGGNGLREVNKL